MQTAAVNATTAPELQVPGRDELVARAAGLRADLWEDAPESDRTRRLTARSIAAVTDAGLMRLMTPRRLGGYEADIRTLLEVATEVGRGCGSTAWITGVLNAGNFVASLFPREVQDEVWSLNADARTALVLGMPARGVEVVDDGVVVTGEWGYVSGSLHADWVGVLIAVPTDGGENVVHFALLRADELEIKDTWHFAGMRGTGSNTVVATAVFVPQRRLLPYAPLLNGETDGVVDASSRYRNSLVGLFSIGLLGSMIGGAVAAFDFVREAAPNRPAAGSKFPNQAESPTLQLDLAEAATKIETAKLLAAKIADTADAAAYAGEFPDVLTRAAARQNSTRVAHLCREAVDLLMTAYGSSAFSEANPLQRIWRDVNVGSRHAGFGMGIPAQLYGRALVGKDPRDISLLV
ncbi:acyl-CoA dehydrogenase family protein [Streptomyces bambusae]|uniref:Acyl-CoA dehydrogenase n=1 Tax=Streptomyces bambusae TaxID=1550616 RepID=A0ABS6Z0W7_9ACTN|nr:acyl-CoA dehydrogenase family protein [Streptomyces bambusae]MBW5481388.1 acyl-CoA dehydrogenase [Streptomyces bambusae]